MARKYVNPNHQAAGSRDGYPMRFRFRNEGSGPARVEIYDDVGSDGWGGGLTAKSFSEQLAAVKGPLSVHVNSAGGDVFAGLGMAEAVRAYPGHVTVVVDGIAASIASVIVQAADDRVMAQGSMQMVHDAWTVAAGNGDELRRQSALLDKISDNLAAQYADRAGGTPAYWRGIMKAETWFTADEAVSAGLADRMGSGAASLPGGPALEQLAARAPMRIAARLRAAAPSGDDDDSSCKTCGGWGRLKHPGTGKAGVKCPGCLGTGTYSPDGDGTQDRQTDLATAEKIRQLRAILPRLT